MAELQGKRGNRVWFLSRAYLAKLPEQLDEGALTKRVGEAGVEGQSGIILGQNSHPTFLIGKLEKKSVPRLDITKGQRSHLVIKVEKADFIPWPKWEWGHTCLEQRWDVSTISPFSSTTQWSGNASPWDPGHPALGWWHQMSRSPFRGK